MTQVTEMTDSHTINLEAEYNVIPSLLPAGLVVVGGSTVELDSFDLL